jgi:hypothetical protein
MHVYEFEGNADVLQNYLLNTQKKNGKTAAPT